MSIRDAIVNIALAIVGVFAQSGGFKFELFHTEVLPLSIGSKHSPLQPPFTVSGDAMTLTPEIGITYMIAFGETSFRR